MNSKKRKVMRKHRKKRAHLKEKRREQTQGAAAVRPAAARR